MIRHHLLLTFLIFAALFSVGCQKEAAPTAPAQDASAAKAETKKDPNLLTLSPDAIKYANLQFTEVTEEQIAAPLTVTGHIAINEDRTVRVGSLFSGRILEVPVKVGDRVGRGQALAKMHTHEVHEAQAEYVKAQAELKQRKTNAEFAKSMMERAERLYQAKAGSLNELEKARVEYQAATQEIARAEAELERAIGHREHLGLPDNLNYDELVSVKAPAAGVVMKREITPGASVNPGDNLFLISDLSSVWVMADVPEKNLSALKIGAAVQIKVAAYPEETFTGRIARLGETLNAETRTIEVRCLVENRAGKLKPEMYASVGLIIGEKRPAVMVSSTALQEMDGQTVVFVAKDQNQFEKRVVKVERKLGELVEVLSGLSRGERVVTAGSFQLKTEFQKDKLAEDE
jgi:cobalt-zinc-cadmium efflux system membrane fusion protein